MPIVLEQVSFAYRGQQQVLANFSASFEAGEIVALVGPSGSGKSTLLAIAGGQLAPAGGSRIIDADAQLAWVMQQNPVLGSRSALDNACLPLLIRSVAAADARSIGAEALARFGLSHCANRPARTLSGGEAQRLCLARLFVTRPNFVLADEPTGQLDAANTLLVADALRELSDAEIGVVVATHDQEIAGRADRIIDLRRLSANATA